LPSASSLQWLGLHVSLPAWAVLVPAAKAVTVWLLRGRGRASESRADAAWSAFFDALVANAEEAERTVIKVPAAHTTHTCHDCGHSQTMPMSVRLYSCEQCAMVRDRDQNASLNILPAALGRQGQGARPQEAHGF